MKKRASFLTCVAGCLLMSIGLFSNSLWAHHGQAGYNTTGTVTVNGVVTDFKFVNPHSIVSLDVMNDQGATESWQGELTSPNHLIRAGWESNTLKPGDKVSMTGYRAKSGANSMWITKISVNGEELKMGAGN